MGKYGISYSLSRIYELKYILRKIQMDCGSCFSQLTDILSRLQYRTSARKLSRVVYIGNEPRASLIVSIAYEIALRSAGHRLDYFFKESTFPSIIH